MRNRFSLTSRYIPENSTEIAHADGLGVVYHYSSKEGKICAIAYAGKAMKSSWHHSFPYKDLDKAKFRRQEKTAEFFSNLEGSRKMKAEWKAERSKPHDFQVGEIIVNSWGYDQTNVDYYEIVKTSSNFVWLRPIAGTVKETGFMCGESRPCPGQYTSTEVTQHKADARGWVNFEYGSGHRADKYGQPNYCSWYA